MADDAKQRVTRRRVIGAALTTSVLLHATLGGLLYWKGSHPLAQEVALSITLVAPTPTPLPPASATASPPPQTTAPAPAPVAARVRSPKPAKSPSIAAPPQPAPPPLTMPPADPAPPAQTPAIAPPPASPPPPPQSMASDYANLVFERIARVARRTYPQAAILRHQEGKVVYHLVLSATGQLLDHWIDPSEIGSLDRAADQAVMAAAPFPQPPDMAAQTYRLSGTIIYRLEN